MAQVLSPLLDIFWSFFFFFSGLSNACPIVGVQKLVPLANRAFVPCQKGVDFDENSENDEYAFLNQTT